MLTVPLGDLAGAYLDALAAFERGRLGHCSARSSRSARQLILIKSRAMLPRPPEPVAAGRRDDRGAIPRRSCARRLIDVPGVSATPGGGWPSDAGRMRRLFRREPATALAAGAGRGTTGARPAAGPAGWPTPSRRRSGSSRRRRRRPRSLARTITLEERAAVIRAALRGVPQIVLQDLLRDVRDRVVVAVTFLAMLELAKRREVVVEQAEPWGPIVSGAIPDPASDEPAEPIRPDPERAGGRARAEAGRRPGAGADPGELELSASSRRCCSSPSGR